MFFGRNDAKAETPVLWPPCEELTHWKRLWCWEGLGAGGEGDDRGWDGWMASLAWWTQVWMNFRSWWWTGKPGELPFMGLQRVGLDWVTELNWNKILMLCYQFLNTRLLATEWNTNTEEWFESLFLTLASYSCFILYPLHSNLQGKLPSTMIQRLYSAQAQGEVTFTLTYLLQLRLCFGELTYHLRICFVPRSVPFEESEKHPCVQEMFFSHGNKQDS